LQALHLQSLSLVVITPGSVCVSHHSSCQEFVSVKIIVVVRVCVIWSRLRSWNRTREVVVAKADPNSHRTQYYSDSRRIYVCGEGDLVSSQQADKSVSAASDLTTPN
ncbi:hypothetical protein OTU49_017425, partial [Cherax quadricarinatus]